MRNDFPGGDFVPEGLKTAPPGDTFGISGGREEGGMKNGGKVEISGLNTSDLTTLSDSEQVREVRTYMTYDKSSNEMKLIMDALPGEGTFVDSVRNRLKEQCGDKMLPAVVNIIIET